VTNSTSRSLPICPGFCISGTTTESGFIALSSPLQSRFTFILAPGYQMNIPRNPSENSIDDELFKIISGITNNNQFLIEQISDIYLGLLQAKVKISFTEYVRWCKTAFQLFQSESLPIELVGGFSALRTIVDSFSNEDRRRVVKDVLQKHIPIRLTYIIVPKPKESLLLQCPLSIESSSSIMFSDGFRGIFIGYPGAKINVNRD
jgi:hypothetical protein